jgi:hypothetical protein
MVVALELPRRTKYYSYYTVFSATIFSGFLKFFVILINKILTGLMGFFGGVGFSWSSGSMSSVALLSDFFLDFVVDVDDISRYFNNNQL